MHAKKGASDVAEFQLRCKAQKDAGEVWFRVITGNSHYKMKSLSMWVSKQCRRRLRQHGADRLVLPGVDFTRRLRRIKFVSGSVLIKLDLKDFYLEGWHSDMAAAVNSGGAQHGDDDRDFQLEIEKAFNGAVSILLSEQYAQGVELDPHGDNSIFHVQMGVGQGLLHAGDLADLIWLLQVEQSWATVRSVQREHGIVAYFRFRDDMIILADGGNLKYLDFLRGMFSRASKLGYITKVEPTGLCASFLNVKITVDEENQEYAAALYTKPNDLANTPLDPRSSQAWHVHAVWPRSMLKVAHQIEGSAKTAATRMVNKFHAASLPPPEAAVQVRAGVNIFDHQVVKKKIVDERQIIWVPLPYHPVMAAAVTRELAVLSSDPENMAFFRSAFFRPPPVYRPVWRNAGPRHEMLVRLGPTSVPSNHSSGCDKGIGSGFSRP